MIRSRYIGIIDIKEISEQDALLKCRMALSLADCFKTAAGETMKMNVMFARKEKDLENELKRKPFGATIIFATEAII